MSLARASASQEEEELARATSAASRLAAPCWPERRRRLTLGLKSASKPAPAARAALAVEAKARLAARRLLDCPGSAARVQLAVLARVVAVGPVSLLPGLRTSDRLSSDQFTDSLRRSLCRCAYEKGRGERTESHGIEPSAKATHSNKTRKVGKETQETIEFENYEEIMTIF